MKKGFTLIELLVVIAIISILTVITVAQFDTAKKKANDVARKGDLSALAKALEMYYTDYGKFPLATNTGLVSVVDNGHAASPKVIPWGGEFSDNSSTPYVYMKVMPIENILSIQYCYVTDAGQSKFALFAMLQNTGDSECSTNGVVNVYHHCGHDYCYAYVSPNVTAVSFGGTMP
jgi:type II secretion system protein G